MIGPTDRGSKQVHGVTDVHGGQRGQSAQLQMVKEAPVVCVVSQLIIQEGFNYQGQHE